MHDPYGFLHYARQEARKQPVPVRVRHWHEYVHPMPANQAQRQANRCMDCGTPYCHSFCPVHNLIPEWNSLVYSGEWEAAYRQLDSTNNFPEFTGRLCPAPCEAACTLTLGDQPVTIKSLERAIADRAWDSGWVKPRPPRTRRSQAVVVVGSGPAGLACAQQLARVGYQVTILEKSDRIGGLLRYGIPDFRLDKHILDRRLAQLQAEGVSFVTRVNAGFSRRSQQMMQRADAVVLACGAEVARELRVPGRHLPGIHLAMTYLKQQNRLLAGDHIEQHRLISARGKQVVVIGGGDTGHDCVGTAIRQGAAEVTQIQYHERPPRYADVLKHWPKPLPVLRPTDTDEEGARHLWGWDTVAFDGSSDRVERVMLARLQWFKNRAGIWQKQRSGEPLYSMPAQLVLLAMGYAHPSHAGIVEQYRVQLDRQGNVSADEQHYRTSVERLFACGDMRRGQSLIVWAIREGRQCAYAVDSYLSGYSELPYV